MQQLIESLKMRSKGLRTYLDAYKDVIELYLLEERHQIINAFNEGYREGEEDATGVITDDDVSQYDDAVNYFNYTYNENL